MSCTAIKTLLPPFLNGYLAILVEPSVRNPGTQGESAGHPSHVLTGFLSNVQGDLDLLQLFEDGTTGNVYTGGIKAGRHHMGCHFLGWGFGRTPFLLRICSTQVGFYSRCVIRRIGPILGCAPGSMGPRMQPTLNHSNEMPSVAFRLTLVYTQPNISNR